MSETFFSIPSSSVDEIQKYARQLAAVGDLIATSSDGVGEEAAQGIGWLINDLAVKIDYAAGIASGEAAQAE